LDNPFEIVRQVLDRLYLPFVELLVALMSDGA
jgi:hypothetical protein